jgi:hypothetical protein
VTVDSSSPEETEAVAAELARDLVPGDVVTVGQTQFVYQAGR